MAIFGRTYRNKWQQRRTVYSLSILLPFCMVFFMEMYCLAGKVAGGKAACIETNLCNAHGSSDPIQNRIPDLEKSSNGQPSHNSNALDGVSAHHSTGHSHFHSSQDDQVSDDHSQEKTCEDHLDQDQQEVELTTRRTSKYPTVENCCIDDSIRFFSTPSYIPTSYATTFTVPAIAFSECPHWTMISLEEKISSFKPPDVEFTPSFPRFERFQVFLI